MDKLLPSENIIHVLPENDLHEHYSDGGGCQCDPQLHVVKGDDGLTCGYMIVHNSYDQRELWEEAASV